MAVERPTLLGHGATDQAVNRPRNGASHARCKQCGAAVVWAQKPGGGWHRPLEEHYLMGLITITDGVAHLTDECYYRVHVCSQADLDRVALERAQFVPGSGHLLTEIAVPCPRCGAEVGERCRTISESHRAKYGDHLQTPHPARQQASLEKD